MAWDSVHQTVHSYQDGKLEVLTESSALIDTRYQSDLCDRPAWGLEKEITKANHTVQCKLATQNVRGMRGKNLKGNFFSKSFAVTSLPQRSACPFTSNQVKETWTVNLETGDLFCSWGYVVNWHLTFSVNNGLSSVSPSFLGQKLCECVPQINLEPEWGSVSSFLFNSDFKMGKLIQ